MCELATPFSIATDQAEIVEGARQLHLDVVKVVDVIRQVGTQLDGLDRLAADISDGAQRDATAAGLGQLRCSVREVIESALKLI